MANKINQNAVDGEAIRIRILKNYKSLTNASYYLRVPSETLCRICGGKRRPTNDQLVVLQQAGLI